MKMKGFDMGKKQVKKPERFTVRLDGRVAKAISDLANKLAAQSRAARERDHIRYPDVTVSDVLRDFVEQPKFLEALAKAEFSPSKLFIEKLLEDGLRAWMGDHEKYPVILEQLRCEGEYLFDLFAAWWNAILQKPGYTLQEVFDERGKSLGFRVHYQIKLRVAQCRDYLESQRQTFKMSGWTEKQIEDYFAKLDERTKKQ
jgi:hypothetical protein